MRSFGRRKKKLIVAFHFQFARQAAWKCDTCRKQGLEKKRRCPWLPETAREPERLVWVHGGVRLTVCPAGIVTPESIHWLERWQVARTFGFGDVIELPARTVDAFCVLENESALERSHDDK